jgi:single-stranded DNA-binding protein
MSNPRNTGQLIGRLARDPRVFENSDGSKKVLFTVYADRNFTNGQNQRDSDAIPVEAFVRSSTNGIGPFGNIHEGDLVGLSTSLRMDRYSKGGSQVYETKVIVEDITFLESRSVSQTRLAERIAKAEAQNQALRVPAPAPAAQPVPAPASAAQPAAATASAGQNEQLPF